VFDENDLDPKTSRDTRDISKDLKSAALDIENAPKIDQRSDQIRNRLVELINKRASSFDTAGRSLPAFALAAFSDLDSLRDAFKNYYEWEDSILPEYGLQRGRK
jgi:hypothetical protein